MISKLFDIIIKPIQCESYLESFIFCFIIITTYKDPAKVYTQFFLKQCNEITCFKCEPYLCTKMAQMYRASSVYQKEQLMIEAKP